MSSVDNRIVNMQFNNKQFESGANQSKRTLAGLESAVSKTGKGKGLSTMASGAQAVSQKFGIMRVAGLTAVATIASKATVAGLGLVKSLTIDPILQGWDEYNTNLKSIQTVMANTGKGIKPVQAALKNLNDYSDQTIYNFSEMAKNVGTFSAAGVDLKTSVSAIKGIANMAALSGSTSQQASTAMYQLSQAIASGRVNLQDWNSVVNAGMGGKNLQSALINTGIAMGKIDAKTVKWGKNIKIAGQSFRQSISASGGKEAWLGSDVLVQTLALMDGRLSSTALKAKLLAKNQKLSSDQQLSSTEINKKAAAQLEINQKAMEKQGFTPKQIESMTSMANRAYESATVVKTLPQLLGVVKESIGSVWANAFTGIVGNFEQSKKMWTAAANSISQTVQNFSMALNQGIFMWKKGIDGIGGRDAVIRGFKALFGGLGDIFRTVGQAFRDVFPPGGESTLAKISIGFMRLMEALRPSESTLKSLRSIFGGIFAVMHIGVTVVSALWGGFKALFGALFEGSGKAGGGVLALLGGVGEAIKAFDRWLSSGDKLKNFMVNLGTVVGTALHPIIAIISGVVGALGKLTAGGPTAFFESIASSMKGVSGSGDKVKAVFESIGQSLSKLDFSKLKTMFDGIDFNAAGDLARQGIVIASGIVTGIASGLQSEGIPAIKSAVSSLATAVISFIKGVFGISSPASTMIPIGKFIVLGIAVGIASAIGVLPQAVSTIFSAIKDLFSGLGDKVKSLFTGLFGGMDSLDIASLLNAIIAGGLMLSIKKMTDGFGEFAKLGGTINGTFKQLTGTLSTMQNAVRAKMILEIAVAVALLTASIVALSFIDPKKIAISLGAIAVMMGTLVGTMALLSKVAKGQVNMLILATSITLISGAMIMLATAVAILGSMDMASLAKGLGAMAIAMGIMAGSMAIMGKFGAVGVSAGIGILLMAQAMIILAGAVLAFGSMDLMTLAKGLGAIAVALVLFTASLAILGAVGPGVAAAGAGILLTAVAMTVLAGAVLAFGSMDISTLAIGLGAIGIALVLFTASLAALGVIGAGGGVLMAGAAMVLLATAMGMLVPVVALLGSMDMGTLAKGIGALALILGVATIALAAIGAVGLAVGPGLIMVAAALALAGVGMLAFGTGFAVMAAAGVAGVAVLSAAFAAIIALLPQLARQLAAAVVSMIEVFAKAAPRIRKAAVTIIREALAGVRQLTPQFAKTLIVMINAGINVLKKSVPKFVEMGFTVIDRFLKSALKHAPSIINSVTKLVVTFLSGMARNMGKMVTAGATLVVKFLNGVANNIGRVTKAAVNLIIKFVNGLASAINANSSRLGAAGARLAGALINGMTGGLLGRGIAAVRSAASAVANAIPDKIAHIMGIRSPSRVTKWFGEMIAQGLADGLAGRESLNATTKAAEKMIDTVPSAIESAMEIASPSAKAKWWGEMIGAGLAAGLRNSIKPAMMAALDLINSVVGAGDTTVIGADRKATLAEATAAREQARVAYLQARLSKTPKSSKSTRASLTKSIAAQKKVAEAAEKAADVAQQKVADAIAYRDADEKGKADILQALAESQSDIAARRMAKAGAESAQAKAMASKNRALAAILRKRAADDAAAAKKYADAAKANQNKALAYYAVEINARIKGIQDASAAEEKLKAEQAELDAAIIPTAKADILDKRAEVHEAEAARLKAEAEALIEKARALAGKDAVAAAKLLDQAEAAAADAKEAADKATQERTDAIAAITEGNSGVGDINPSRSVLEDAASVVDRYSESLVAAQQAAATEQTVLQFTQNNNSPEALSVSEVYRQTNNLVSLAALKIGPKPPGTN